MSNSQSIDKVFVVAKMELLKEIAAHCQWEANDFELFAPRRLLAAKSKGTGEKSGS